MKWYTFLLLYFHKFARFMSNLPLTNKALFVDVYQMGPYKRGDVPWGVISAPFFLTALAVI